MHFSDLITLYRAHASSQFGVSQCKLAWTAASIILIQSKRSQIVCKVNTNEEISHKSYQDYKPPCSNVKNFNAKLLQTYPQVFDLFMLFQFLKERLEKVRPLDMSWSHAQGINISSWKKYDPTSVFICQALVTADYSWANENHCNSLNAFCGTYSIKN